MPDYKSPENASLFVTTRWSVVLAARDAVVGDAAFALEALCKTYWRSLYGYARRHGFSPHDAEDLTQAFFARLLEKDYLQAVRRELGPFRAFLQMAFKRFLSKDREHASALRRGGGVVHVPFDFKEAESGYAEEAPHLPADEVFELRWAMTVLATVMQNLREEFRAAGREAEFDTLKVALSASKDGLRYADMAATLESSEGAIRVAVASVAQAVSGTFSSGGRADRGRVRRHRRGVRHLVSVLARA